MNVATNVFITLLLLNITGCKVQLSTDVPISKLTEKGLHKIDANFFAEVPACSSFEDSRQPSHSVIQAQSEIPKIFGNAKYVECFTQKMDSFAHFTIPVEIGAVSDATELNTQTIKVFSWPTMKTKLALFVPEKIKDNLLKYNNSNIAGFVPEQTYISFNITNDVSAPFSFYINGDFVDGKPITHSDIDLKHGDRIEIRMSNVHAAQSILTAENSGQDAVIILMNKE